MTLTTNHQEDPAVAPTPVETRRMRVPGGWAATLIITGHPPEVGPDWLQPLTTHPGLIDLAVHIDPIPADVAADRLRRRLARLESGLRHTADRGRPHDPAVEAATEDAHDLAAAVARGQTRLHRVAVYLTLRAPDPGELETGIATVRAVCAGLLTHTARATYRTREGWTATLPLGLDPLRVSRTLDTASVAAMFPFGSPDLAEGPSSGVTYGPNLGSRSLARWDRWSQPNHNTVVLGRSGSGKSYLVKLDTLRSLYQGVEAWVIDPEDEYTRLADAVDGTVLRPGTTGRGLNPFALPTHRDDDGRPVIAEDALTRRRLFLITLLGVLLDTDLTATDRAVLDAAVTTTYTRAGITTDPATWHRAAPTMTDLGAVLVTDDDPRAADLAARLAPFTATDHPLFTATTPEPVGSRLTVISLRDVPDESRGAATLLALDLIWHHINSPTAPRRRLIVVDEAWLLLRHGTGGEYLARMARAGRKRWAGLTIATQDAQDVLTSPLGRTVITNAATQILLRQAPQTIDTVAPAFRLAPGEREFLLTASPGEALLISGDARALLRCEASPREHALVTTNPVDTAVPVNTPTADDDGFDRPTFIPLGGDR